jgi:hypothetical protein
MNAWKSEHGKGRAEAAKQQRAQDAEVNVRSAGEGFLFHKKGCSGCEAQLRDSGFEVIFSRGLRAIRRAKLFSGNASKLIIDSDENVTDRFFAQQRALDASYCGDPNENQSVRRRSSA